MKNRHISVLLITVITVYAGDDCCQNAGTAKETLVDAINILQKAYKLLGNTYPPIRTCIVAFHARLKPSVTLGSKQIVVFDDVITNIGQAYDQHSGFFTAPCDSIYFFACTFLRGRGVELNLQMVKNNNEISRGHAATGGGSQTGSMNAVVYLRKGDVVKIRHFPGVGSENIHDDWCFFTDYSV